LWHLRKVTEVSNPGQVLLSAGFLSAGQTFPFQCVTAGDVACDSRNPIPIHTTSDLHGILLAGCGKMDGECELIILNFASPKGAIQPEKGGNMLPFNWFSSRYIFNSP
jgi:hypothetical protein